ncbi:hypothetical protein BDF20DRAFT_445456 [Mycotypha africana]|uniref:uncharacterized protein n=1 Tax=Mycotypha africana TaxID=64632 RepID=UPI002300F565|nr:uncharacterized protein BDF20DRAFT_445456 [Mycotypha africana]KAI8982012.1 hypothetical protein BDF20DRAFT_445456 [Mycotypha africana]
MLNAVIRSTTRAPLSTYCCRQLLYRRQPLAASTNVLLKNQRLHTTSKRNQYEQDFQQHPFIQKLKQNPHITQQIMELSITLQSKGLTDTSNPYSQMLKIMKDSDLRKKMTQLTEDMKIAGLTLDMKSLQELQEMMMKQQKDLQATMTPEQINEIQQKYKEQQEQQQQEHQQNQENAGVWDKVKGLFK